MPKIITDKLELLADEAVITRKNDVGYGTKGIAKGELLLTNMALIYTRKNLFGKVKEVIRMPFASVRMAEGKPQIIANNPDRFTPLLEVYLDDGMECFKFTFDSEADEWEALAYEAITGKQAERKDEFAWVGELADMADSVSEGIFKLKGALGIKSTEETSCKCTGCGAALSGFRGENVKCPYCRTVNSLR